MTDRDRLLADLFAAIDAMDTPGFLAMLTPSAVFRFGSSPAVHGKDAIGSAVDQFFATIAGIRHDVARQIDDGPILACEGAVTYTRHDATEITLPFANVFELDGDLICGYRVYVDIGPLYATGT